MDELIGDYKFFPTFLLFGLLGKTVDRFREWLVNMHTIQARIHDIALQVGGNIKTPERLSTRKLCFRLYRYLTTIHAVTYASVNPYLPQQIDQYESIGLLTSSEIESLKPMKNKIRDTMMAWVSATIKDLIETGTLDIRAVDPLSVPGLRGICARHHDLFRRNFPNMWLGIMRLALDFFVFIEIFGLLFRLLTFDETGICSGNDNSFMVQSFQRTTYLAVFLVCSAYLLTFDAVKLLSNPFQDRVDMLNTNALIGSTEQCIFASLRGQFVKPQCFSMGLETADSTGIDDGHEQSAGMEDAMVREADPETTSIDYAKEDRYDSDTIVNMDTMHHSGM